MSQIDTIECRIMMLLYLKTDAEEQEKLFKMRKESFEREIEMLEKRMHELRLIGNE